MRVPMDNMFEENKMTGQQETESLKAIMGTVTTGPITRGVYDCAHILETTPESVMLCILMETNSNDISITIQHKLIEAYCWENDIPVHKLATAEELITLLNTQPATPTTGRKMSETAEDLSCVLINYKEARRDTDKGFNDWANTGDVCLPS